MAKFLCRTSEEKLWSAISESCQRRDIVLDRDAPNSATINSLGRMSTQWDVKIATSPSEEPMRVLLTIQANYTPKAERFYLALAAVGAGMLIPAFGSLQSGQVGLGSCMGLLGLLSLLATLLFSFLMSRYVRRLFAKMLHDLRAGISLQKLEPFEIQAPRSTKVIVMSMAIIFVLQVAMLAGSIIGTVLLVFSGALFFALLVVRPRLASWRRVLHDIHTIGMRVCAMVFVSIFVVFLPGAMVYCLAHHQREFHDGTIGNIFSLACTSPQGWTASPRAVAREIADVLPSSTGPIQALVVIVLLGTAFFMGAVLEGILSGRTYWQLSNLSERSSDPVVPPTDVPQRFEAILVGIGAILSGTIYWSTAIVSLDAMSYLLFGRALVFLPIGWSLEFFKIMLNRAGVPALMAFALVLVMMAIASLPGLALALVALNRVIRGAWSTLTYLLPSDRLSKEMAATHREWLQRTCLQVGMRPPRFRVIDSWRPMLSSEHSVVPFLRGRIVVSSACCELLGVSEIRALLAHEVHHLKYAARYIQLLKTMSTLLLCPIYYLLILYDFARNEYEADTFAVSTTDDVETFKTALVKLQVGSCVRKERGDDLLLKRGLAWLRSQSRFLRALPLYFNDSILGAAYPTLQERFAHIDSLGSGEDKQSI